MRDNNKAQDDKYAKHVPDWCTAMKQLKKDFFYYGRGMQEKFVKLNKKICIYIGKEYGISTLSNMMEGKLIIHKMDEPEIFKTEEDLKKLNYNKQSNWQDSQKL